MLDGPLDYESKRNRHYMIIWTQLFKTEAVFLMSLWVSSNILYAKNVVFYVIVVVNVIVFILFILFYFL